MSPLLLLFACTSAPTGSTGATFTDDSVLAPALARLDTDADGKVTAEEYARVAFKGPTFVEIDVDKDGAVSLAELRTIVFAQDPEKYFPERKHPMRGAKDGRTAAAGMPGAGAAGAGGAGEGAAGPPGGPQGGASGPGMGGPRPGGRGGKGGPGKGGPGIGGKGHREPTLPPPSLLVLQILCEEILSVDPASTACVDTEVLRIGEGGSLQTPEARALLATLESASDAAKIGFPTALRAANAPASSVDGPPATTAADP
jgi:hypothetical protein